MATEKDVSFWENEIDNGLAFKKDFGRSDRWQQNKNYFRHIFPSLMGIPANTPTYSYNLVRSLAFMLMPSVFIQNPYINVTPTFKVDVGPQESMMRNVKAKIWETMDNWFVKEIRLARQVRRCLLDHYLMGAGIVKLGYDTQYGFVPDNLDPITSETGDEISKDGKKKVEHNEDVKPGMPWALRSSPEYIIVPFGTQTFDDAEWIAHIVFRKIDDVKRDTRYVNTKDLKAGYDPKLVSYFSPEFFRHMQMTGTSTDTGYVQIVEIRDARNKKIKTFAYGNQEWIRKEVDDLLQIDGMPYVDYHVIEDPDYFWEVPDVTVIEDQQKEMIESRTQTAMHRRLALLKFLYNTNSVKPEELEKFLKGEIGVAVGVDGDLTNAIYSFQPHIPPDLVGWTDNIRSDSREALGLGRNNLGEMEGSSRRSATEASIANSGFQIRMTDRQNATADFISRIVRKCNQYFSAFWTAEKVAMVVGLDGMRYWVKSSLADIKGEYDTNIDIESMQPMTRSGKKAELLQMMQIFAKNPTANIDFLMKGFIREFPYLDAAAILPQAEETMTEPMNAESFMKQQMNLMSNPKQMQTRRQGAVGRMMLPPMGG